MAASMMLGGNDKRYPQYRDSGVEWLGKIPAHWEVRRLKSFARVSLSNVDKKSVEGQASVRLCNYVAVYGAESIDASSDFMPATATAEQIHRFSLRSGDVLITKDSETWLDIAVPALVSTDLPGVLCGYHLAHIRPSEDCDGAYLSRCLTAVGPRDQYQMAANGITRFGLTGSAIGNSALPQPPIAEQRAIATFLSRETAMIDTLIERKERLVDLLQERRTALISQAVTRGLAPHVGTKNSGVDWFPDIPAHWQAKRLKSLATVSLSNVDKKSVEGQTSIRLCNYVDVYGADSINADSDFMPATATADQVHRFSLRRGDVLMTKDSETWMDIAVPALVSRDLPGILCGYHLAHVRPRKGYDGAYLNRCLSAAGLRDQLRIEANGVTRFGLTSAAISNFVLPVPPIVEQRAIADFLDHETAEIDALVAKVRDAIERLKEYRLALISAAVTGKIDVREESAR